MDGEELKEGLSSLSDTELTGKIARLKKSLSSNIGVRLPDGGEKLRANIKLHEDELEWRKRVGSDQLPYASENFLFHKRKRQSSNNPPALSDFPLHKLFFFQGPVQILRCCIPTLPSWIADPSTIVNTSHFFVCVGTRGGRMGNLYGIASLSLRGSGKDCLHSTLPRPTCGISLGVTLDLVCMCMYTGAPYNFEPQASPSVSSSQSTYAVWFLNKLEAEAESKPANAFQEELYALNPCDRKSILNNQFSQRKRHKRELLSQEAPYKSSVDKGEQVLNVDLKGWDSSTRSKENIASCFLDKFKASQAQSSYTRRHANVRLLMYLSYPIPASLHGQAVVLVDEEDPDAIKETEPVDQVIERKATTIYYPSRVDPESVEICCLDMESLAPEAYLSSTIMNFYI
ncbi:hypothetical protein MTR67_017696, partial [Solanum verrucosum]